ncbi:MAG: type II toxin-antitoxin system RelE/ParE family toxin [Dehalococcoidia bacterium]|nr:type II toxin-antitoxin system RelE/ParE family toxin [Dehalococcoidia bacterium]
MYSVILTPAAQRDLKKLPSTLEKRAMAALDRLKKDPREPGVKKLKGQKNEWRVRVGDYRILFTIDDAKRVVQVYRIGPRSAVY